MKCPNCGSADEANVAILLRLTPFPSDSLVFSPSYGKTIKQDKQDAKVLAARLGVREENALNGITVVPRQLLYDWILNHLPH